MHVLVTGSVLAVELTAALPGPHALNAEEQNLDYDGSGKGRKGGKRGNGPPR